jgi:hypothetical protein
MTAATINIRNRQNVLFYTVQKNNGTLVHVNPQQVVPYRNALNSHLKQKINFQKLKKSIANIKELQNLPNNVRKVILQKVNRKLAILNQ